jgi:predicted Zn-dependent peptidase
MLLIQNDFKTIQFAIYFTDLDEEDTRVCRFLLPKLLTSHTNKLSTKMMMSEKMEDLYGAYFKTKVESVGNLSVISIILTIVDPKIVEDDHLLDEALTLLNEVLFERLTFNREIFDEEKRMIIEQWETLADKKRLYAQTKFYEHFFKNDAYGYPMSGTLKDTKKMTLEKMQDYYKTVFLNNTKKFVVNGRIENQDQKKIEDMLIQESQLKIPFVTKFREPRELLLVEEKTDMQQAIIKLGYHFPVFRNDALFNAAVIFDTVLGGYAESRLFKQIREKDGLCYDISSSYDYYKGVLTISSGVDVKQKDRALDAIRKLVIEMTTGGITDDELKHAKSYYAYQVKSSLDSQSVLTKRAFIRDLLNHRETFEEKLLAIKNVTIEDLNKVIGLLTIDTIYILYGGEK